MPYLRPELFTAPGYWAGLLQKAQLTHREPYQLRHSYASLLLMAGAHPAYLAKQLEHKDWGMIRTIYAQWVSNDNPDYRNELAVNWAKMTHIRLTAQTPKHRLLILKYLNP